MEKQACDWVEDDPLQIINQAPADKVECYALISWLVKECNRVRAALKDLRKGAVWTPNMIQFINHKGHIMYLQMALRKAYEDADHLARGLKLSGKPFLPEEERWCQQVLENHGREVTRRKTEDIGDGECVLVWRHSVSDLATDICFSLSKEECRELSEILLLRSHDAH